jgi:putative ABC transport system ATP-binding protein
MSNNPPEQALIELRQVVKEFHMTSGSFTALKGIDLTFQSGEFASIVGKSGSGKSTLINMISGIDIPTRGSVTVMGVPIHQMNHSDLSVWRGKNMGIVFQFFQLLPMLTVLENVMLPMDFCNMFAPAERETRARSLLDQVELGRFSELMPAELSGGQQQCAAIARALANDPPLIVADEPTGNLDSRTADVVFDLMMSLEKQGKTIIMVTHDPSLAARTTRTVLISDGEIIPEAVHKAIPWLPHEEMLWLTHHLKETSLQPGEPLLKENTEKPALCVIVTGRLELPSLDRLDEGTATKHKDAESYLTAGEMKTINPRLIWRAAAGKTVQLLTLSQADFTEWQHHYPVAEKILTHNLPDRAREGKMAYPMEAEL